jgi:hypothetical protein
MGTSQLRYLSLRCRHLILFLGGLAGQSDNSHLTNRFCKVELDPIIILRWHHSLSKISWVTFYQIFRYQTIHHLYSHTKCLIILGVRECVKKSHIGCKTTYVWIYKVEIIFILLADFVRLSQIQYSIRRQPSRRHQGDGEVGTCYVQPW